MAVFALWATGLTSLTVGVVAGFVMHRSDFCIAGMVRDMFLFRRTFMMRILALLVLANMLMIEAARMAGWVASVPYPGFGSPSLSNMLGGLLFGVGMVLSGGCVAGTLYKFGTGNVVSAAALAGLILGSVLYAEFHEAWKRIAEAAAFAPGNITLAQVCNIPQGAAVACASVLLAIPVAYGLKTAGLVRRSPVDGYLQPWKAALILATLVLLSVVIIGIPPGITTGYTKIGAWLELQVFPRHVGELAYFASRPFAFSNRLLGIPYSGGPGPATDSISLIQLPLIIGLIAGGCASSVLLREFRIYCRVPIRQLVSGLLGGVMMGCAARMAPACTVWHILGGLPVLATQSILFCAGLLPGAWLGGKLLSGFVITGER